MSNEPQNQPPAPPPPPPQPDPLQQLNTWAQSIGAQQKSEGKSSALRDVAEQLGMSVDEAKAFIEQRKTQEREGMAEADRKLAEANDLKQQADVATAQARDRELRAEVRAQLMEAGLTRDQAKHAVGFVNVDPKDWDDEKVGAAIESLKTTFPQLFPEQQEGDAQQQQQQQQPGTQQPPDSANRGTPPAPPGAGQAAKDAAQARLAKRHPQTVKSSS